MPATRSVIFAPEMSDKYAPGEIETKWQRRWADARVAYVDTAVPGDEYYMLMMFPYPSGSRLHVGHGRNYILGDALYRCLRMAGRKALNPMGWDAFGLPAENAAIQRGVPSPRLDARQHRPMKEQFRRWGILYDWSKEIASCVPEYYRWNQWLFLRMWERGLAYRKTAPVNWCPGCRTVLANEQVVDGACERCGRPRRDPGPDAVVLPHHRLRRAPARGPRPACRLAREGQDDAAQLDRPLRGRRDPLSRRRPRRAREGLHDAARHAPRRDLPGAGAGAPRRRASGRGVPAPPGDRALRRTRAPRAAPRARGGRVARRRVATPGPSALNPATGEPIPVWLANYVLPDYGTGRHHGRAAHDQRDLEFARQVRPAGPAGLPDGRRRDRRQRHDRGHAARRRARSIPGAGTARRTGRTPSASPSRGSRRRGSARARSAYRLRDWLISRQRYWGTPIPAIYCAACGIVPVPDADLPGRAAVRRRVPGREGNPLARQKPSWRSPCPKCGGAGAARDRHDGHLRGQLLVLPALPLRPTPSGCSTPSASSAWLPVDQYIGGIEHAILHLLYARFVCRVLHDFGLVALRGAVRAPVQPGHDHALIRRPGRSRRCRSRGATRSRPTS